MQIEVRPKTRDAVQPLDHGDDVAGGAYSFVARIRDVNASLGENDILPGLALGDERLVRGGPTDGGDFDFFDRLFGTTKAVSVPNVSYGAIGLIDPLLDLECPAENRPGRRVVGRKPSPQCQLQNNHSGQTDDQIYSKNSHPRRTNIHTWTLPVG